jgi:hypothetical protein
MKWYASSRSMVPKVTPRKRCERIFTHSRNFDTPIDCRPLEVVAAHLDPGPFKVLVHLRR